MNSPKIVIGIASRGRAPILAAQFPLWLSQTVPPDEVVICGTQTSDIPELSQFTRQSGAANETTRVTKLYRPPSSATQRNAIIDAVTGDILIFCDDDFFPAPHFVETVRDVFECDSDIVGCNLTLQYDGASSTPIEPADALHRLSEPKRSERKGGLSTASTVTSLYGCNMGVRLNTVRTHQVRFDDSFAYYGWLEDLDFSRQLGRQGTLVRLGTVGGIHLGVSSGRVDDLWLGFSQIVNPLYLHRKQVISFLDVLRTGGRCFAANIIGSLLPSSRTRRRRLRGNFRGLLSLINHGPRPERVSLLPPR